MKWIYKVEAFLLDIFFPNKCPVCDKDIGYDELMCRDCEKQLEFVGDDLCPRCGQIKCICKREKLYYDRCFSFIFYKDAGKSGVIALKERHGTGFAEYFAIKAAEYLKENGLSGKIDIITSVPVTKRKMRETGYNHAHIYAKMIHRHTDIPVNGKLLIKTDKTLVQHNLSAEERKQRAAKAFRFIGDENLVRGKTVLLCDDIITTGSTLSYCAKALKQAGAQNVICCTIAITPLGGKDKSADGRCINKDLSDILCISDTEVMAMLEKNDLNILQSVIARESELIEKYENYLQQIREPQLRSDVQSLLAQHRNQYNAMLGILEGGE